MVRNLWKLAYFPIMLGYSWEYIFLPQRTITKSLTTTQVISNNYQGIGKWGFPDAARQWLHSETHNMRQSSPNPTL